MWEQLPLFPEAASSLARDVDALSIAWALVSVFFTLLIAGLILYFMVKYRRQGEHEVGLAERAPYWLEVLWSVVPLVICLAMFGWGARVFFQLYRPPAGAVEYYVTGKQWMWKFQHPDGRREINHLHVPVGQPTKLIMTSEDVIHSFYVPAFRAKMDVVPGRYTTFWFEATIPGTYELFCAEYCGVEHSRMGGFVHALDPHEYEVWLAGDGAVAPAQGLSGPELFAAKACDTCHRPDSNLQGPDLADLFGREVELADGSRMTADEKYVRESILDPTAEIVKGYTPLMPTYAGQLTEEEIVQLIVYLKSLADDAATESAP
ncbi:MAG: cytochrome c oxidase subunit II [Thermoanaerobaculia bacterium]